MESNKTLLVGCGINYAFNHAFKERNSFYRSNFSYTEILPQMFSDPSDTSELKSKFKKYLNNHNKLDLEEFLRYGFTATMNSQVMIGKDPLYMSGVTIILKH